MSSPVLMSIFEVAAFKSVDLPLQVGQGVADLSPATHLGKTFYRKDNFRESKFETNPILDVKKYMVGLKLEEISHCDSNKRNLTSSASSCRVSMLVTPCFAAILSILL